MDLKIAGRRALVTGSTAGIGYAIAEGLAREGAEVVVNGRQADSIESAIGRIKSAVKGAKVTGVVADAATKKRAAAKGGWSDEAPFPLYGNTSGTARNGHCFPRGSGRAGQDRHH